MRLSRFLVPEHFHPPKREAHPYLATVSHPSFLQPLEDIHFLFLHMFTWLSLGCAYNRKCLRTDVSQVAHGCRCSQEDKLGHSSSVEICAFLGILFVEFNCHPNCLQEGYDPAEKGKVVECETNEFIGSILGHSTHLNLTMTLGN